MVLDPVTPTRIDLPAVDAPTLRLVVTPSAPEPLALGVRMTIERAAGDVRAFAHPGDRLGPEILRIEWSETHRGHLVLRSEMPGTAKVTIQPVRKLIDPSSDPSAQAEELWTRACALWAAEGTSDRQQAVALFRTAADAWEAAGRRRPAARALLAAGAAAAWVGDDPSSSSDASPFDAARLLDDAATAAARLEPSPAARALRGAIVDDLGLLAWRRGALDEARGHFTQALDLRQSAGDRLGAAETQVNAALVEQLSGNAEAARTGYEQARAVARTHGDLRLEASVTQNMATLLHEAGALEEAVVAYERALELTAALDEPPRSATAWSNLAVALRKLGHLERARLRFTEALAIQERLGDARGRAATLNSLGQLGLMLGEPESALQHLEHSLRLRQAVDDRRGLAATLHNLGMAERALGRLEDAEALLRRALRVRASIGDLRGRGASRHELAETLRRAGDFAPALDSVERALALRLEHDPLRAADSRRLRAEILLDRDERLPNELVADETLVDDLRTALAVQTEAGADEPAARTLGVLARLAARTGDHAAAVEHLDSALQLLHRLRHTVRSPARRATFFALRRPLVEQLVAAHRTLGQEARAFEAAERARARSLLDQLGTPFDDAADPSADDASFTPEAARALLDDDTVLLSLFAGTRGSVLWLLTRDTLEAHSLPPAVRLEELATRTLDTWSTLEVGAASRAPAAEAADRLSALVLQPGAETLRLHRRWLVVADGALAGLPVSALPFSIRPAPTPSMPGIPSLALDAHEVIHLPSTAVLAALRARGPVSARGADLVLFADPLGTERLPASRREAETLAALFTDRRVELALGAQATRAAVLGGLLDGARRIHFATHGRLDVERPSRSALLLSNVDAAGQPTEPALRPADVDALHLDAELVVLSGCSTATGRPVLGEGVFGLPRAFLGAGARSVIASLWPVADGATAELMTRLYAGLLDGLSPAAALRHAQRGLRTETRWRHPSYWAPFLITGDWTG